MVDRAVEALHLFLTKAGPAGPKPIVWVGAGASAAAGYPTLGQLEEKIRAALPGATETGFALVDRYVAEWSPADLENLLQTHLGALHKPAPLHGFLARLAGARVFAALFTTNYDALLEDALKAEGIPHVTQILESNYRLQARANVQVLKLHGGDT